jgi:hypothetical protein
MKTDIPLFLATDIFNRVEVSVEPVEKWADRAKTQQATDRTTGDPIWVTQVYVRSPKGDVAVLPIRTSGAKPSVKTDQAVTFEDFEAVPWANEKGSGVMYRAKSIKPATASSSGKAA